MFCKNCGFEISEEIEYCPQCGAKILEPQQPVIPQNPAQPFEAVPNLLGEKVTELVSSSLFLAATILVTISAASSLILSTVNINVLFAIFMWTAYASAKKGRVNYNNIRNISGTVFATKVLLIIAAASSGLCGIIALLLGLVSNEMFDAREILSAFASLSDSGINSGKIYGNLEQFLGRHDSAFVAILLSVIGVIFIVLAVLFFVYALCGVGSIHKFLKSTYEGIRDGNENIQKIDACKGWLLAMGIIDGLSALTVFDISGIQSAIDTGSALNLMENSVGFITAGTTAAAYILGFVLVGKLKNND